MKFTLPALLIISLSNTSVAAKPFHNEIPSVFHGNWGSAAEDCADEYGVNTFFIDAESVNYYESNDYLQHPLGSFRRLGEVAARQPTMYPASDAAVG